jgi:hypothetical protein
VPEWVEYLASVEIHLLPVSHLRCTLHLPGIAHLDHIFLDIILFFPYPFLEILAAGRPPRILTCSTELAAKRQLAED